MDKKTKVKEIIKEFDKAYQEAVCSLDYSGTLQLLIATQLSAQCTDARVNIVTKDLFEKYRSVEDFAKADLKELEQDIKATGFYHNKAKNIKNCCIKLINDFGGKVPGNMEDLLSLPGVGRKTANLVLGDAFGVPGIVVDTHAKRVASRIGLTRNTDPEKVEYDLMKVIPKQNWSKFCHQMVYHGRGVCNARNPKCEQCTIKSFCEYGNKINKKM